MSLRLPCVLTRNMRGARIFYHIAGKWPDSAQENGAGDAFRGRIMNKKDRRFQIENLEDLICALSMVVMFIAIGTNIVLNWILSKRYGQMEELGTAAYMFGCYAGFALLYKRNELTAVTFVVNHMPPRLRWLTDLFRYGYLVFFGGILTYQGVILCANSTVKKLPALKIPYLYLDICIVFGFGLLTIRTVLDLIKHLGRLKQFFAKGDDVK